MDIKPLRVIQRYDAESFRGKVCDRSTWPPGEWDNEPDLMEWRDEATGYPCLIARGPMGSLCGYVGVPPMHPAHGKDYGDVDVDAHGGLTYSDQCAGNICHVALPGEPDEVWWLGFDCAHAWDVSPGLLVTRRKIEAQMKEQFPDYENRDVYRNIAYVQRECTQLAGELKALESGS